jgi:hypothetical protein
MVRKLFFVPIIHTPADMGTMGTVLSEISAAALGNEFWVEHLKTVSLFWDSVSQYFNSLEIAGVKIFQDGLVAGGAAGLKIIAEGSRQGSVNYQIVSDLIERGADLIKTEDIALVQREYDFLKKISTAKTTREREASGLRYRLAQKKLLTDRDNYIAKTVENTLKKDDTGVLFLGAYHDILSKLPGDIFVVQVKDLNKVRQYHAILSGVISKSQVQFKQLAAYLISPIINTGND